ncbi:MAG: hypothetical protein AUI36_32540 [Cyanobacteria bacterium 13_1_40CM_2_61_4]|nr:MAG: hypothetical protein AUI36_32540 [Cyanobacteria bacterium 13_1_40CM_2_61_4]
MRSPFLSFHPGQTTAYTIAIPKLAKPKSVACELITRNLVAELRLHPKLFQAKGPAGSGQVPEFDGRHL